MSQEASKPMPEGQREWNPNLYDSKHDFVWKYGADLISLLAPQPAERILDVGCGTGHLTAQIAASGARVTGIDRSAEMVAAARKAYPALQFEVADARELRYDAEFDAVFSNAVLHWIKEPELVVRNVARALRPGGRFVAELGGKGNVGTMLAAFNHVLAELHAAAPGEINPWYYPSVSEYATLLEQNGLEVRFMTLFDRMTPLADGEAGLRNWMTMFCADFLVKVPPEQRERLFQRVGELLRPQLFHDGEWRADYRRLRFAAWK